MNWRNYTFTVVIVFAAALALIFPQLFTKWGNYELKNTIIPLLQVITFGVGCSMHFRDFKNLLKMPKGVLIGVTCQYSIMPFVGFFIAKAFNFPP